MPKLTAKFEIPLGQCVFAKYPMRKGIHIRSNFSNFIVDVYLLPLHEPSTLPQEPNMVEVFCISTIRICVEGETQEEIPPITMDKGGEDYSRRVRFFQEQLKIYKEIAAVVLGRIIAFFKYKLHSPLLELVRLGAESLNNPKWYDNDDTVIDPRLSYSEIVLPPGYLSSAFSVGRLTAENEKDLAQALNIDPEIELYEEILSDAQSAIFQKNYRRGIVEMTLACEIAIKQTYFAKSTIAARAYEYLEDKRKVTTSLLDYIGGIAEYAFGESFREFSKGDSDSIEELFRCRNKAVHRGELAYRDVNNKIKTVNEMILAKWWISVETLLKWLETKRLSDQNED